MSTLTFWLLHMFSSLSEEDDEEEEEEEDDLGAGLFTAFFGLQGVWKWNQYLLIHICFTNVKLTNIYLLFLQ